MATQILLGSITVVAITAIHAAGLVYLAGAITYIARIRGPGPNGFRKVGLLTFTVLAIVAIHSIEAWIWAVIYLSVGELTDIGSALYFSVVTATTLGYGDLTLSEQWRLLSSFEAMGGLILFGASTAFFMEFLRRLFFSDDIHRSAASESGSSPG